MISARKRSKIANRQARHGQLAAVLAAPYDQLGEAIRYLHSVAEMAAGDDATAAAVGDLLDVCALGVKGLWDKPGRYLRGQLARRDVRHAAELGAGAAQPGESLRYLHSVLDLAAGDDDLAAEAAGLVEAAAEGIAALYIRRVEYAAASEGVPA